MIKFASMQDFCKGQIPRSLKVNLQQGRQTGSGSRLNFVIYECNFLFCKLCQLFAQSPSLLISVELALEFNNRPYSNNAAATDTRVFSSYFFRVFIYLMLSEWGQVV